MTALGQRSWPQPSKWSKPGGISLKSRSAPVEEAISDSLAALEWLRNQGCEQIIFKYCSTFDSTKEGNIGPVADALADALGAQRVIVCPAFPTTGRTLYPGHLFVNDVLLNASGMENHPLTPMTDPDIRRWLGHQTPSSIGHLPLSVVQSGVSAVSAAFGDAGQAVHLADLWPTEEDITATLTSAQKAQDVTEAFATASDNAAWSAIPAPDSVCFPWDARSRCPRCPKFASQPEGSRLGTYEARALLVLGDNMTTDHISPPGWIAPDSAAGQWLSARGGDPANLNVYAAYRGNWEVMLRGLFTNRLAVNHLREGLPAASCVLSAMNTPCCPARVAPKYGRATMPASFAKGHGS